MDDPKPSSHDLVNDVLSWFANTLQVSRAAFRYAITVDSDVVSSDRFALARDPRYAIEAVPAHCDDLRADFCDD
jgi:hypothetical protein